MFLLPFFFPHSPGRSSIAFSFYPSVWVFHGFPSFFSQLGFAVLAVARVVVTFAVRRFDLIKMIIVFGI